MKERAYIRSSKIGKATKSNRRPNKNCYMIVDDTSQNREENKELSLFTVDAVQSKATPGIQVKVQIDGEPVNMESDTGTSVKVVSTRTWKIKLKKKELRSCNILYTGELMGVLGHEAMVNYQGQSAGLPVVTVDDKGSPLFGQNWLNAIKLD